MAAVRPGPIVATAAVADWYGADELRAVWLTFCVGRHFAGDWGDLDAEDRAVNDRAVACRFGRVASAYSLPPDLAGSVDHARVWVITDDVDNPASPTTILWPSDY